MTPTALPVNLAGIPDVLKARRQWLGYVPVWNDTDQRFRKPNHGRWGEREHWRTFDDVINAGQRPGFIYGDGVCGLDVDRCVLDGVLSAEAQSYVDRLNSYTELSLSGTGVHVIAFGPTLPTSPRRRELWSHGHWIALTGQHVAGTPTTVEDRSSALEALARDLTPTDSTFGGPFVPSNRTLTHGERTGEMFRLLRHLKALDNTKELAWSVIQQCNRERCDPPKSDAWLKDWFGRAWDNPDQPGFGQPVTFIDPSALFEGDGL